MFVLCVTIHRQYLCDDGDCMLYCVLLYIDTVFM